jgi:uncharacterized membrane protein
MKVKRFNQWRMAILMVVGVGFGLLMKFNLGILGLFLVVDGLILLSLLRIKVEDEIKDERLERLNEKAAAMSFMVLIPVVGMTAIAIFLGAKGQWSYLQSLGMVLGYVAVLGVTVHLISWWYLSRKY